MVVSRIPVALRIFRLEPPFALLRFVGVGSFNMASTAMSNYDSESWILPWGGGVVAVTVGLTNKGFSSFSVRPSRRRPNTGKGPHSLEVGFALACPNGRLDRSPDFLTITRRPCTADALHVHG